MRSQFIHRWTRSERAVVVEVCERGDAEITDIDAVAGIRASGPKHERRRRRRPDVLDVDELALPFAHDEIQVACARHKNVRSQFIDRRTRSERAVAVDISECGRAFPTNVNAIEGVRASGPLHEDRRRRRPDVLDVDELATVFAHYEVQIACERHERCWCSYRSTDAV